MNTLTVTHLIKADVESVWAKIDDVRVVQDWHPSVDHTDLLSAEPTGLGATRRCTFYDGSNVVEEVITHNSEAHTFTIEIREFDGPMNRFVIDWEVTATPGGATQVTVVANYEMKFGLLGTAMNFLAVKGQMASKLGKVLKGLEHHVLTGELIGKDFTAAA